MSLSIIPKTLPVVIENVLGDAVPIRLCAHLAERRAACPRCGHVSERVHSEYWRTIQDLPWRTVPVRWP
jgi:transposase